MNPLKLLDVNAFLAALLALSGALAAYLYVTYPPPRPTERVAAEQPAAPEDETVVRVKLETITMQDAERLKDKLVVMTFIVGYESYTWGAGKDTITVTGTRGTKVDCAVHLKGDRPDVGMGKRVTVVGTLRVINHADSTTNKAHTGFTEVRIVEQ